MALFSALWHVQATQSRTSLYAAALNILVPSATAFFASTTSAFAIALIRNRTIDYQLSVSCQSLRFPVVARAKAGDLALTKCHSVVGTAATRPERLGISASCSRRPVLGCQMIVYDFELEAALH